MVQLFDTSGNRKYLVQEERERFKHEAKKADNETRTFCLLLYYTGIRISEGLNLLVPHIDYANKCITIESLKKRTKGIYRQIPIPDNFLDELTMTHNIKKRQSLKGEKKKKIWTWARNTAYCKVKTIMDKAEIQGIQATPKGLRHGFAIHCLEKEIPLNLVRKWMGHSSLEVTAIYANALGREERAIASKLWN